MFAAPDFARRLQRYAGVIVRVGLNLRPGQPLLIAEPFELQGVSRAAEPLVDAVEIAARALGSKSVDVIWGDETRWRAAAERDGDRAFEREVMRHGERMREHARRGGALLFLQSAHPDLMTGIPAAHLARLRDVAWQAYGRVAPDLIAGRANWTAAPAPTAVWAEAVFGGDEATHGDGIDVDGRRTPIAAGSGSRALQHLWSAVFEACRVDDEDPIAAWRAHLTELEQQRETLQARDAHHVRMIGQGTDLVVPLAPAHVWCVASLRQPDGRSFVPNLPTEEIFTAPRADGAAGVVRVARPVAYGGGLIVGAELEFQKGRVVRARAQAGEELLQRVLTTDDGAARLGEVALVPRPRPALLRDGVCFQQTLLDENALPHIALGEAYPFCVGRAGSGTINHSLVHLDLPIEAEVRVE